MRNPKGKMQTAIGARQRGDWRRAFHMIRTSRAALPFCILRFAFTIGLVSGCTPAQSAPDNVIRVIVRASPTSFDPRIGTDEGSQRIHQLVYSHLLTIDDRLRVVAGPPALASRLETPGSRLPRPLHSLCHPPRGPPWPAEIVRLGRGQTVGCTRGGASAPGAWPCAGWRLESRRRKL